jgi:phosphate:Na+ symporter
MMVMGDAMKPLRAYEPFLGWMAHMENPLLGLLAGALFTALVQSSSATTGVVIVMAGQGLIALPAGIAMAFGANIGTCVTALLAAIGKPREALRAAVVHVLFNVAGVLVWIAFVPQLADLVRWISPAAPELSDQARLAVETPRQIANAHTIFNVANTLLFLGFVPLFARLVQRLVPDRPLSEERAVRARYLDDALLSTPSLALDRSRLELLRMGDRVRAMLADALETVLRGEPEDLAELRDRDDAVDALHGHIVTYLGKASGTRLTEVQTKELVQLLEAANDLENIGDLIETNLVALGRHRRERGVRVSAATEEVLTGFHAVVLRALDSAILAVTQRNERAARAVLDMKLEVNRRAESAALHEARRLVAEEPHRLAAYTLETDVLGNLKRIYYFCKRMARTATPTELG